jgi:hypothetical protein
MHDWIIDNSCFKNIDTTDGASSSKVFEPCISWNGLTPIPLFIDFVYYQFLKI